jgi:hypothetical protein
MTADPTETLRALMPFAATLGIELLRYEPGEVRARLAWAPELCTSGGAMHGGSDVVPRAPSQMRAETHPVSASAASTTTKVTSALTGPGINTIASQRLASRS